MKTDANRNIAEQLTVLLRQAVLEVVVMDGGQGTYSNTDDKSTRHGEMNWRP